MKRHSIKGLYSRYRRKNARCEFPTGIPELDRKLCLERGDLVLLTSPTRVDAQCLAIKFALEAVAAGKTVDIICGCYEEDFVFEYLLSKMGNVRLESVKRRTLTDEETNQSAGDLIALCGSDLRVISFESGSDRSADLVKYFSGDDIADVVFILSIDHAMYSARSKEKELLEKGYGNRTLLMSNIESKAFTKGALVFVTLKTSLDGDSSILLDQEDFGRIREVASTIFIKRPGTYYDEKRMIENVELVITHNHAGPTGVINVVRSYNRDFYEPSISTMLS